MLQMHLEIADKEGSQIKRSKKNSDRPLTAKHCTFQLKEVAQDIQ